MSLYIGRFSGLFTVPGGAVTIKWDAHHIF